jgi:hypothetical protein
LDITDDPRLLLLSPQDNVLVAREAIARGTAVMMGGSAVTLAIDVPRGHKVARVPIAPGDCILKYGAPIGIATQAIAKGEHTHVHNIRSNYTPTYFIEHGETTP